MSNVVALSDYTQSFQYEINPPGENLYPNMNQTEMVGRLIDAFWEMRMTGFDFLANWTCDQSGNISPQTNAPSASLTGVTQYIPVGWYTDDNSGAIGREIVQAIILFAGYRVCLTAMMAAGGSTSVTARAGSVESSVTKSPQVYQAVLKALTAKIDLVLTRLSDLGSTNVEVLDAVIDNTTNMGMGEAWWVR